MLEVKLDNEGLLVIIKGLVWKIGYGGEGKLSLLEQAL